MKKSPLAFTANLPKPSQLGQEVLLVYDESLPKFSQEFKSWLKLFPLRYPVEAGESLKSVDEFPSHIHKIVSLCRSSSARNLTLVVVGGGSVGDFGGFVASILKRGVRLVQIPSTWLAAIDSAHGGKTALNVGSAKNQIGTFYPAEKIFLVKSLLLAQPSARAFEGFGELLKMALLAGGPLWKKLAKENEIGPELLWKYLRSAIEEKYKIVNRDPLEKTGHRHLLNFGHTVGHALEIYHELPHGIAINYGMDFALRFGVQKRLMSRKEYDNLMDQPILAYLLSPSRDQLLFSNAQFLKNMQSLLLSDKKKTSAKKLRFVFLKKPGQGFISEVTVDELLIEICRQKEEERND